MQIDELLAQMGGLQSMARELGMTEQQAVSGAGALLPALLGGMQKRTQAGSTGAESLGSLFEQLGGGALLDQVLAPQATNLDPGNNVLGQVFGSKDVSRAVANNAAAQTGISSDLLRKMLPMLAMMVAGYLARQHANARAQAAPAGGAASGGLGDLLGSMLGGRPGASAGTAGALGGLGGLGALVSMLGGNGGGNPLDDILRSMTGAGPR